MANVLDVEKRQQILALGRLGWSLRRIEQETGVRRETVSRYLKAAGVGVREAGRWGHPPPKAAIEVITDPADSKVAIEVITDSVAWPPPPARSPRASACEPYREQVERGSLAATCPT